MAWFAAAIPYITAAVGVVGAVQQGQAAAQAGEESAAIAEENAKIARQQAVAREDALRREQRRFSGEQRAATAQAGISFQGTSADIAKETAQLQELDLLNTRYEGLLQSRGLLSQAEQHKRAAQSAKQQSFLKAGSSVLGATSNYFGGKA
jgi:hypothetical protein